jgi:hypothetical protein
MAGSSQVSATSAMSAAMAAALLEDKENGDYRLMCGDKVRVVHSYILATRWVGYM